MYMTLFCFLVASISLAVLRDLSTVTMITFLKFFIFAVHVISMLIILSRTDCADRACIIVQTRVAHCIYSMVSEIRHDLIKETNLVCLVFIVFAAVLVITNSCWRWISTARVFKREHQINLNLLFQIKLERKSSQEIRVSVRLIDEFPLGRVLSMEVLVGLSSAFLPSKPCFFSKSTVEFMLHRDKCTTNLALFSQMERKPNKQKHKVKKDSCPRLWNVAV